MLTDEAATPRQFLPGEEPVPAAPPAATIPVTTQPAGDVGEPALGAEPPPAQVRGSTDGEPSSVDAPAPAPGPTPANALSPATVEQTLSEAVAVLDGLDTGLFRFGTSELTSVLTLVDRVTALAAAARVTITAEAVVRGVPAEAGHRTPVWVRRHAPSTRQAGATQIARLAEDAAREARKHHLTHPDELDSKDGPLSAVAAGLEPDTALGVVWEQVRTGRVGTPLASVVLRQMDRLGPRLQPGAEPVVTTAMLEVGVEHGPTVAQALRTRLLADHGQPGELDNEAEILARCAFVSQPEVASDHLTEYRLGLTPTQAAVFEAALGPLSAPAPNETTGEPDLRPAGQRRAEALADLCERASPPTPRPAAATGSRDRPWLCS